MSDTPKIGSVGWIDLTIADAPGIRDFYQAVVGWNFEPVDMGGYQDYSMVPPSGGDAVAGICHARGDNANVPPQWLIYITVADLDASLEKCAALGGKALIETRDMGSYGRMSIIQDPAGAVAALVTPPEGSE